MELRHYNAEETIFRQGDTADCMFRIESGKVGIFMNFERDSQTKLSELSVGEFLGEMGLLEQAPRSATAISLNDDTVLCVIDERNFSRCLAENPENMRLLLQQMSTRLRRISRSYSDACRTVSDVLEAEKAGKEKSASLKHRIAKTLAGYEAAKMEGGAGV